MGLTEYLKPRRGDLNGAIQLFFDNAGTIFVLILILRFDVFGVVPGIFGVNSAAYEAEINDIIFASVLPGIGFSIFVGGWFYAIQGALLSSKEGYQATALPYGVNTPGAFAVTFGILLPVTLDLQFACGPNEQCLIDAARSGLKAGIVTNFVVGLISVALSFFGVGLRKVIPPMALLTALAGIGLAFLTISQLTSNTFAQPLTGLLPLFLMVFAYFGDLKLGGFPKSALVVIVGTILGWADQTVTGEGVSDAGEIVQWWGLTPGFNALGDWEVVGDSLGTVFPVAFAAAAGTLMNVYSAEQAGDSYGVTLTMVSDGVGTIIAALFGCPFSTSVYIGHPAYKKMGAGTMYSAINGCVLFLISLTGLFAVILAIIPGTAVAPLLVFVGLMICQEAMVATRPREYPAYMLGIVPSVVDWANTTGATIDGTYALRKGALLTALFITCISVFGINRQFLKAGITATAAAAMAFFGVTHMDSASVKDFDVPDPGFCNSGNTTLIAITGECPSETENLCVNFAGEPLCGSKYILAWRFAVGYLLVAVMAFGFHALQKAGKIEEPIEMADEEELKQLQAELMDSEEGAKHVAA